MRLHERLKWILALEAEGTIKSVLNVLNAHANNETGKCWLLQDTICRESGFGPRTVRRALKILRDKAVISRVRTGGASIFFVNIELMRSAPQAGLIGPTGRYNSSLNIRRKKPKRKPTTHIAGFPFCRKCKQRPGTGGDGSPCFTCQRRDRIADAALRPTPKAQ